MDYHYIVSFIDDTSKESFRLPQCECGKLAKRYYEFLRSDTDTSTSYIIDIVCEECLNKLVQGIFQHNNKVMDRVMIDQTRNDYFKPRS